MRLTAGTGSDAAWTSLKTDQSNMRLTAGTESDTAWTVGLVSKRTNQGTPPPPL
jgi:hypothetical protein